MTRTKQFFTKDTTTASIKEMLDEILGTMSNVVGVSIKWNANNCTLFVQYVDTEVRFHGESEEGDRRKFVEFSER